MIKYNENGSLRTIILAVIIVPIIGYLLYFAHKKDKEAAGRARKCHSECSEKGYPGYDFKWDILTGPQCQCLE